MLITVSDDDLLKEKFDRAVSHAKKLIFISNFTQDEFYKKYKHLNQPSCVIYLGVNEVFYEKKSDLNKIDLNKIRIGYSGVRAGHKNFKFVVDSLRSSPYSKNIMLYCFGGGRFNTNEKKYIKESGLKVLRYRGDDKKLLKFYRSLDVFIFPSLVEGFGIPPLEAMAMGIPLLASNRASIPEVCREGAIYFNPEDSISLQSAFKSFLDQSNQEEIIQTGINVSRKYNWLSSCNNIRKFITD
ncbi:glycosyltransferase [Amylibacter sp.]|nr:glycosyltransferase [Amylibacter sp.]